MPTPTATPSPAPSPTAQPSASPTATPSPSPTPTATLAPPPFIDALYANDGTFLGNFYGLTAAYDCFSLNAIGNQFGTYGSKFQLHSIWNQFGLYGSTTALQSPYDQFSITPPAMIDTSSSAIVFYLTKNASFASNPKVDPDTLQSNLETLCGVASYR